ncbi:MULTISPECIES: hypothetical protein [Providencia]|uniref:hypothetical protein n=1 Tax=Providencia TaxID=586 RepID=UPI00234AC5CD|nr:MULTISPECIES: hypothetical protein [Providencia]MDX4945703.1 hypothetical protein [Providencia manganoxydans]
MTKIKCCDHAIYDSCYTRHKENLETKLHNYIPNVQPEDSEVDSKGIFWGLIDSVNKDCEGKGYYKYIGKLNAALNHPNIKSTTFCDNIRRVIIQQAEPIRTADNRCYLKRFSIKKICTKAINVEKNSLCEAILLKVKNTSIDDKSIEKIEKIVNRAKSSMSNKNFQSTLLEAQVLALTCRNKNVYEKINQVLVLYIEIRPQQPQAFVRECVNLSSQSVQQNKKVTIPSCDKERSLNGIQEEIKLTAPEEIVVQHHTNNTPLSSEFNDGSYSSSQGDKRDTLELAINRVKKNIDVISDLSSKIKKEDTLVQAISRKINNNDLSKESLMKISGKLTSIKSSHTKDEFIARMNQCKDIIAKLKSELVREKINKIINEYLTEGSQSTLSEQETEPSFSRIYFHHSIAESIECKIKFNGISSKSLSKIEDKIKAKFNEVKSSKTPEMFEKEMLEAQSILKKYDNDVVCKKIDEIINKYLDRYYVVIKENYSPISRIWSAVRSVSGLQEITPRKLDEFKAAIIDSFKFQSIEFIESHQCELKRKVSKYIDGNIEKKFIEVIEQCANYRRRELKESYQYDTSEPKNLFPKFQEVKPIEQTSIKEIFSHLYKRFIIWINKKLTIN